MATGMVFAALAFGAATLVEINVVKTVVDPAPPQNTLLQVLNVAESSITVKVSDQNLFPEPIKHLQDPSEYTTLPLQGASADVTFQIGSNGQNFSCVQTLNETSANSLIVYKEGAGLTCKRVEDHIEKTGDGKPLLRFLNTLSEDVKVTVDKAEFEISSGFTVCQNQSVSRGVYSNVPLCLLPSNTCSFVNLGLLDFGASYTFVIYEAGGSVMVSGIEDVKANNVHVAWQIPQYVLMTAGEVMFSITGLEFSYSQSPANMKSVLQAGWLLTVAFGNVIVLIVAEGAGLDQWKEFLLFAGLLLFVCIIFSIMAAFYKYVDPDELNKTYIEDSKYTGPEEKKRKSENLQMDRKGKSTKL